MTRKLQPDDILEAARALTAEGAQGVSSSEIHARVGGSYATVGRLLDKLVQAHALVRTGKARAIAKTRARVEHVFGAIEQMGGKLLRTIGQARANFAMTMMAACYNLKRLVFFQEAGIEAF